ncbi:MAG: hypothetical protein IPH11_08520 [Ignavibacteriales bacterium]|nr:hypothetical protein [Ignavibacteriales bacterium]
MKFDSIVKTGLYFNVDSNGNPSDLNPTYVQAYRYQQPISLRLGMKVTFNAIQLSSGIYFYTLKAGSFIETKKMTLMK